jgi:hypothetical protein
VIMGNRRAPKRLGPCMSPPAAAIGRLIKPNRPPTAYEQRVYEVGGNHSSCMVVPLLCERLCPGSSVAMEMLVCLNSR